MVQESDTHPDPVRPKLPDQVRAVILTKHYSLGGEEAYVQRITALHSGHRFSYSRIVVRDGKGNKDRVTVLPDKVKKPLRNHLERVGQLHDDDLKDGCRDVYLPCAAEVKYPNAGR